MRKVVLAHPCYGPLQPEVNKSLRVALMSAAQVAEWVGDVSTIREGWVGARNRAVKGALEDAPDCDGIVWVDDDVMLPPTGIKRLLSYDLDFVTGIVHQKMGDYWPLVAKWQGNGFAWFRELPENVLAPVDGCGFGICYTSTKMLRDIQKLPDFKKDGWFNQFPANHFGKQVEADSETAMSEDFSFCMRAKAAGYQLYADTGLICGHMKGPSFVSDAVFKRHMAKKDAEAAELAQKQASALCKLESGAA
jgi:hypothetical protein